MVQSEYFNNSSLVLIVLNTMLMATESYGASEDYEATVERANLAFTIVFALEVSLRLVAYGHRFFYNSWNLFDLTVVVTSIIESLLAASIGIKVLRALRISRIFRTIRIVRRLPRLHTIIRALAGAVSLE